MHTNAATVAAAKVSQEWAKIQQASQEAQQFAEQNQIAKARLPIEWITAQARMISAKAQEHAAHNPPPRAAAK